jgi:prepilin-type processing-associated H-X9-DG protein
MKKKIALLIIEEDKGEQAAYEQYFEANSDGYACIRANSVKNALEQLKTHQFDAIISNINFVDGHVFDILPYTRGIPFIIVTERGYEEIAVMAMKRGASDYLVRDVDRDYLETLPGVIEKAAHHKRNEKTIGILIGAFENIDECVSIFSPEGDILFANRSFRNLHNLDDDYHLDRIEDVLKPFQIIGEPDLNTYLKENIKEQTRYRIFNPETEISGSIRLVPVVNKHDDIMGYVLLGHCDEE